jgi:gliding motility-associated-like protein
MVVQTDTVPTIDLGADSTICEGDSVQLDATFSRSNYSWNTGSVDSVIYASAEGLYSVTTTNLCGSDSDSFYLEVDSVLVPALGNDTILCLDDTLMLSPNTPQATGYVWSDNSTDSTFEVTQQGTYSVTVSNTCGQFSDSVEVLYDLSPVTNLGPDSTYCLSSLIELDATWSRAQYLWNTGSNDSSIIADTTGRYWVEVTNLCGFDDDTVRINYIVPINFDLGNDTILCPGESITLDAPAHQADYLWNDGSTDSTLQVSNNGTFSVTATNLCGSFSDQIEVSYDSIPIAILPPDTTVCEGTPVTVAIDPQNASDILWSTGSINKQVVIDYPDTITATLSNHCGSSLDTMIIHHQPYPKVDLGNDTIICDEALVLINLEKLDSNVIPQYLWSTGDETESIEVNDFGTYSLTVTDQWNCSDQDIINIESCGINIYIPSAFSPNGDGLNEVFKVEGYGFDKFHMSIFNRWGNEIFNTKNPELGWDGSYQNTPQSAGVYTYRIWVDQQGYDSKTFIGKVTLVR